MFLVLMQDGPMAKPLLTDELWALIEHCLPAPQGRIGRRTSLA